MKKNNDLLIVEMSSSTLNIDRNETKDYILEGIFGQIDQKNRNNRIYTEDEYVPQIEKLQEKIKSSKLLGELDHPTQFDTSLKNVSHVVENLFYDKESKQVRGKIRLLDTDAGRQAKALVDAGVPLQISSRAAGAVESNGKVKIKQLFTYDLVADPGFENAELKRVNESYGFSDDGGIYIYEMGKDANIVESNLEQENINTQIKENKTMAEFVKAEDFNKYSEYLAEEIKSIKKIIDEKYDDNSTNADEKINRVIGHGDHLAESINKIGEYVGYLAEKLDGSIQYTEHVAEKTDQGIQYSESIAEKLDQNIQYTEHVAEKTDQGIQYSENIAEKLDQGIQYTEHVAEGVSKLKDFANYLAEAHNSNTESGENIIEYVNYLKENMQSVSEYAEYIAESINEGLVAEEGNVTGEEAGKEAGDGADGAAAGVDNPKNVHSEKDKGVKEEGDDDMPDNTGEDGALDPLESYKKKITSKLDRLVESATKAENENPSFFKIVSKSTQEKYNKLNEDAKTEVRNAVRKRGFMTEAQIASLIENSSLIVESKTAQPYVLEAMPTEYKEAWDSLSEAKQNQILSQSKYHKLNTEYQVANFWQTRDLRESAPTMEKVSMVKESKETEENKGLGYDVTGYAKEIKKRFSR